MKVTIELDKTRKECPVVIHSTRPVQVIEPQPAKPAIKKR